METERATKALKSHAMKRERISRIEGRDERSAPVARPRAKG
jgi:hypothetical protein